MAKIKNTDSPSNQPKKDELGSGMTILSFCIPIAGAIVYYINKDESPKKARTACYAALWGLGIGVLLNIIATLSGA